MKNILTRDECQAIIDSDHDWAVLNVTKKRGGTGQCKQAPISFWNNYYPNILHECLMKYDVGDFFTTHTDASWHRIAPNHFAHTVWITPLNDDYEGGDLYFDNELVPQDVGIPIKRPRKMLHEITPVTTGTRYSLVAWEFIKFIPREEQ